MNEQAYRNLVAAIILGTVFGVLALLYLALLGGAESPVAAVCGIGFLIVVFFAWAYLMKPGYGLHARLHRGEQEEDEGEPPSSGAP
ncbi:MAG: hypothetical protein HY557_08015 [Euryarchaeota archaeon]|nr:hypothetical protein [Euryarchaeota archaeon]